MQSRIDPKAIELLELILGCDDLHIQRRFVKELAPYMDAVIPAMIDSLHNPAGLYADTNLPLYFLAISADPRGILPMLRFLEKKAWLAEYVFERLRLALSEEDDSRRRLVIDQLIAYLEAGPNFPPPEDFDPDANEKFYRDLMDAVVKECGSPELDEETKKSIEQGAQHWRQPPSSELEEKRVAENLLVLSGVIDMVSEFGHVQDPRLAPLLSRYIHQYDASSTPARSAQALLDRLQGSSTIS